jgi:SAM-dependent methyltransferase
MSDQPSVFAEPRTVSSIGDCHFYHSMSIPDHGEVTAEWDLRGREAEYLGNIDLAGKTVLEIGTASGHLCFWMEKQGAEVVAYDLSENQNWDIVPYSTRDFCGFVQGRKAHMRKINNSWWFAHERFASKARVAYGTVYDLSDRLGRFDIVTLGSILLHLRDPFLAMQKAASLALSTMVVTDRPLPPHEQAIALLSNGRVIRFLPDARAAEPFETWWRLSPNFIAEVLQILGFHDITSSGHKQRFKGQDVEVFTIVARRAAPQQGRTRGLSGTHLVDDYAIHDAMLGAIPGRHVLKHLVGRVRRKLGGS